jgi:nitronate monooxygenase
MAFDPRDLTVPIIGAPMAGGPSTPALAAAVSTAGGLGFVAAGYLTAVRLADDIEAARALTSGPLGVNLFVPQPSTAVPAEIADYRARLEPLAAHYGVQVGLARSDDDGWSDKLDVVAHAKPDVVSFTFAFPPADAVTRLRDLGITTVMTVTSVEEAHAARALCIDVIAVQGPEAGGHRGTTAPDIVPPVAPLDELLGTVVRAVDVPVIAAGGLATAADVDRVLRAGACAAQVGTALLLTDEAGTNAAHRAALASDDFRDTVVTRAFSGRYARGLRNDFTRRFDDVAPFGYPEVHYMTSSIRRAAVAAGDPHGTNLWAGTAFKRTTAGPAGGVVAALSTR